MPEHRAQESDSILSLARQHGIPPEKIWDHPSNRELREGDREKGILLEGDRVTIPERETKEMAGATEARHRFRLLGSTPWIKLRFVQGGQPRAGVPYQLCVGSVTEEGELDDDGALAARIPADAREGYILLGEGGDQERHDLDIGRLDPAREIRGAQERLNNLGLPCGREDNELGPQTRAALREFQRRHDLDPTGELDERTKQQLRDCHGS